MIRPPARPEAGFTLLEVLVAFIIAAIALAVLFRGAADSLVTVATAAKYEEAVARAKSHMAASGITPVPGDQQGDDGSGFHFRVLTRALESYKLPGADDPGLGPRQIVTLYALTVWVTWSDGGKPREVRLDSERLGTTTAG